MNGSAGSAWPTATPMQTRDGWTADELSEARMKAKDKARNGNGFGLGLGAAASQWQTPKTVSGGYTRDQGRKGAERPTLSGEAELWQTPVSDDRIDRERGKINSRGEPKLSGQVILWGTPRSSDAEKGGPNQAFGAGGTPLPAQAAQWPTPMSLHPGTGSYNPAGNSDFTRKAEALSMGIVGNWPPPASRDHKGENSADHLLNGTGRLHLDQLPNFVAHCYTPPAPPPSTSGAPSSMWRPISRRLFRWAMSSVSPTQRRRWLRKGSWRKKRLNPWFVEWLQAWPKGHALCACSGTEFILWQRHMRGALSALPTASGPWIWAPPNAAQKPVQIEMFGG